MPEANLERYQVYVDESFFKFWGFKYPDGNFCYVIFGLLTTNLAAFEAQHSHLLNDFKKVIVSELQEPEPVDRRVRSECGSCSEQLN